MSKCWTHFGHILDITLGVKTSLLRITKYVQTYGHIYFLKCKIKVSKQCPKFGHIIDRFWTFPACLDKLSSPSSKCPKFIKILDIFLNIFNRVGHVLGTFWAYWRVWTSFGHIMDTFDGLMSKICPSHHCAPAPG